MNIWKWVTVKLWRGDLHVPDATSLERKLKVTKRALMAAQADVGNPHAANRGDAEEAALVGELRDRQAGPNERQRRECHAVEITLTRLRDQAVPRFDEFVDAAQCEVERLKARRRDSYRAAHRLVLQTESGLRAFRETHRLARPLRLPELPMLHYALLVALVIVEAGVNTWAFAIGSVKGMVGGLAQALIVALINIAAAVAAGFAVRYVAHVHPMLRVLGALAATAYAAFLGAYTLLIGHYRTALAADWRTAEHVAIERLLTNPWQVGDVHTLLLMLSSVAFALLAMLTAIYLRDPYPGYAAVCRDHDRAEDGVAEERDAYRQETDQCFEAQLRAVDERLEQAIEARHTLNATVREARQMIASYENWVRAWSTCGQLLLRLYWIAYHRTLNRSMPSDKSERSAPHVELVTGPLIEEVRAAEALLDRLTEEVIEQYRREAADTQRELNRRHTAVHSGAPEFFRQIEVSTESAGPPLPPLTLPAPA